jgi:hypothetical protein
LSITTEIKAGVVKRFLKQLAYLSQRLLTRRMLLATHQCTTWGVAAVFVVIVCMAFVEPT